MHWVNLFREWRVDDIKIFVENKINGCWIQGLFQFEIYCWPIYQHKIEIAQVDGNRSQKSQALFIIFFILVFLVF